MPTTNQLASTICAALGMPSRFAADKPPVSPTLRSTLASYMRGLSDESLAGIAQHAPQFSREAATREITRRAAINPDTYCPECGELLSEYGHCWQHHYPPMDPAQDKQPASLATPHYIPCGQCGACAANEPCARLCTLTS